MESNDSRNEIKTQNRDLWKIKKEEEENIPSCCSDLMLND